MEIKFELDTEKSTKAAVAIATAHALAQVSLASESPNLAIANAIATIIIVAILYCPRLAPKRTIA
jgi:hypothetical protein